MVHWHIYLFLIFNTLIHTHTIQSWAFDWLYCIKSKDHFNLEIGILTIAKFSIYEYRISHINLSLIFVSKTLPNVFSFIPKNLKFFCYCEIIKISFSTCFLKVYKNIFYIAYICTLTLYPKYLLNSLIYPQIFLRFFLFSCVSNYVFYKS